VEAEGERS